MVGGLGVAPGANIGTDAAVFEATHGSAPKYKGQNKVNPTAMILSGKLMLAHLGEDAAAQRLEDAVAAVIAEGKSVTYDMKPTRTDPTAVGTSRVRGRHHREAGGRQVTRSGKVSVVGAGFYGSTTAQRLAEYDIFDAVVLVDIIEGKPQGIALDINQSRPIEGFETKRARAPTTTTSTDGLGHRRDHRRPAAQAGHEPDGPAGDQRQDRPRGHREGRRSLAGRGDHRRVQPAGRDDRAGLAGLRASEAAG